MEFVLGRMPDRGRRARFLAAEFVGRHADND
jgi:hypothetical protein